MSSQNAGPDGLFASQISPTSVANNACNPWAAAPPVIALVTSLEHQAQRRPRVRPRGSRESMRDTWWNRVDAPWILGLLRTIPALALALVPALALAPPSTSTSRSLPTLTATATAISTLASTPIATSTSPPAQAVAAATSTSISTPSLLYRLHARRQEPRKNLPPGRGTSAPILCWAQQNKPGLFPQVDPRRQERSQKPPSGHRMYALMLRRPALLLHRANPWHRQQGGRFPSDHGSSSPKSRRRWERTTAV